MGIKDSSYVDISNTIKHIRKINNIAKSGLIVESGEIKEKEYKESNVVPYTDNDVVLKNSIQPCKTQFGADFSKLKTPMLYYKDDGDITLSGIIPSLNNAKFQFRFIEPSGNGCFIWVDSIQLNEETINKFNKIYGVYKNWKQYLLSNDDIKPLSFKSED